MLLASIVVLSVTGCGPGPSAEPASSTAGAGQATGPHSSDLTDRPTPAASGGDDVSPVDVTVGMRLPLVVHRFWEPAAPVEIYGDAAEQHLGTVTADSEGGIDTSVTIPQLDPGVHTLEFKGQGAGGTQVTKTKLLRVAGRPSGSYTTYLTGFSPRPATPTAGVHIETVEVTIVGIPIGQFQVNRSGGVLVSIPTIDRTGSAEPMTIEATSTITGKTVTETIIPIPTTPSLWATSSGGAAIDITADKFTANGLVHSEGGVRLGGSFMGLAGGVEYATTLSDLGQFNTFSPAATRMSAGQGAPSVPVMADYRPGGRLSTGPGYRAVPVSACVNGELRPKSAGEVTGVVYVPCRVVIAVSGDYPGTIAAEDGISIVASKVMLGSPSDDPGVPSVVTDASGAAVSLVGAHMVLRGQVVAPHAHITVEGARTQLVCGVVGSTITVSGADSSAPMSGRCGNR